MAGPARRRIKSYIESPERRAKRIRYAQEPICKDWRAKHGGAGQIGTQGIRARASRRRRLLALAPVV